MLIAGQLMLPDTVPGRVRLAHGQVQIRDGRIFAIAECDPSDQRDGRRLGTPDQGSDTTLIAPGFIDAHVHLPQFDSIGADGLPLLDWLERVIFPAEVRWEDAAFAGHMTARVADRLLAAGTTGVAAYASVHFDATRAAMTSLRQSGLRAIVGQVLMDQQAPPELLRPAAQLLKEAASHESRGRVQPAVTPRFAVSCSNELLYGAGALAQSTGWPVQTHLSETREECELVRSLHGQIEYLDVYHRAGLLTDRSIFGHGIWLSETERTLLAAHRGVLAHCPTANLFLAAGSLHLAAASTAGIRLALGSDIAGGPDVAMPRVARAMIETAKHVALAHPQRPELALGVPVASQAWHAITAGNADALGWADAGRLAVGCSADVVLIEPARGPAADPNWLLAPDPLSRLLYAFDERWITSTIVQGRQVYGSGRRRD